MCQAQSAPAGDGGAPTVCPACGCRAGPAGAAEATLVDELAPLAHGVPSPPGYEVLEELGHGGMGVVYLARQTALKRRVALKVIRAGAGARPEEEARFQAEAEAAARLQHPNIVQVHDVGVHDGQPFFSLEYCAGGSLSARLREGPLAVREAATLVEALARAMQHAHEEGIVHRDLKPANVLLAGEPGAALERCVPKIADFGLAKRLDADSGQTRPGAIMGTPSYMAPEQADGLTVGPAADVWALGAILYEALTGQPPFKGETTGATLALVRTGEPQAPRRARHEIPRDLETICLKCLHKGPAARFASAGDLADDLRNFLAGQPIRARRVGLVGRSLRGLRRRPATALALLMLFLALWAAGGGYRLWRAGEERRGREPEAAAVVEAEHYASVAYRHGAPEGVGPLGAEQAERLPFAFRLHRRAGRVERMDRLSASRNDDFLSWPGLLGHRFDKGERAALHQFSYEEDGRLAREEAFDAEGRLLWALTWSSPIRARLLIRSARAEDVELEVGWSDEGLVREMWCVDRAGRRCVNRWGTCGLRFAYDDRGLVRRLTHLGPEGQPQPGPAATTVFRRDALGRTIERTTFDGSGRPALQDGHHRQTRQYDEAGKLLATGYWKLTPEGAPVFWKRVDSEGHVLELASLSSQGRPIVNREGYHRFTASYDERGKRSAQAYFGLRGEPVFHRTTGQHRWTERHDERGNSLEGAHFGVRGEPILNRETGVHRFTARYDARGNRTAHANFGIEGEPVLGRLSDSHRWTASHDEGGRHLELAHFGIDGKPLANKWGWARIVKRYDRAGNLSEELFWKATPEGALTFWKREDAKGRVVEWALLTPEGRPTVDPEGAFHRSVVRFDGQGRRVAGAFFGLGGEPVLNKVTGTHRWADTYDERGNRVTGANFGVRGEPVIQRQFGIHRWAARRDVRGNEIDYACFGVAGEPVTDAKVGAHRRTRRYDERGRVVEVCYYGTDGQFVPGPTRFAKEERKYDAKGDFVESAFWKATPDGTLAFSRRADAAGRTVEWAHFTPEGLPGTHPEGKYHRRKTRYDERGKRVEQAFFGMDGKPAVDQEGGAHRWTARYENGQMIELLLFGTDGQPLLGRKGYHKMTRRYDASGKLLEVRYADTAGAPVAPPGKGKGKKNSEESRRPM